ncbi:RNA polymerase sigma factor [Mucilaginibacter sp.]|uniref:RNA polymerase sigma factor n=1 Tax=Mucilaginibacter sp. TaxID=1882438 RepID=UPI003D122120
MQTTPHHPTDPQHWNGKYGSYLQKIALSKINDTEQARDLVQDTFLAALESLDYFKGNSTEKTWLTGILLHKVMDLYRKQSVQQAKETEIIAVHARQQSNCSNEDLLIYKEFMVGLKRNLAKMPRLWADVFQLKYLENTPTDLICRRLGITTANFWTISHRSRLRLRTYLISGNSQSIAGRPD